MSEFFLKHYALSVEFYDFIDSLVSKNPQFFDYVSYRLSYLIPIFIAFFRNKSNLRVIFFVDLIATYIGIFTLDFVSETNDFFIYTGYSLVYLLPIFIALIRNCHNLRAIFICNLIFGFTGISWLVILIWAVFVPESKPGEKAIADLCRHCKELIRPSAKRCHHCHQDQ